MCFNNLKGDLLESNFLLGIEIKENYRFLGSALVHMM